MKFSDLQTLVNEKGDGRTFTLAQHTAWIKLVRDEASQDKMVAGFGGLYFLYKEATVIGGSVISQADYPLPSDFVDDLSVFFDSLFVPKVPAEMMDKINDTGYSDGTPTWWRPRGTSIYFIPAPDEAAAEIKLLYCALPDEITSLTQEDYFMKHFPMLHLYGMAWQMAEYLGKEKQAEMYHGNYEREKQKLALDNRHHRLAHANLKFTEWTEYSEKKAVFFPQYAE